MNRKLACLIKMTVMQDFFVINYHSWKAWRIYSLELNWSFHALLCSSTYKLFPHLSYRTPHLKEWLGAKNFPSPLNGGLDCQTRFPIKKMSFKVWFNDEAEALSNLYQIENITVKANRGKFHEEHNGQKAMLLFHGKSGFFF